jgi:predicted alpha/beta hydrolase
MLRGERIAPPDASAVVVCGHAMMVDRRTLDRPRGAGLASALAALGLEVLVFDARGHGESVPRARQGARWSYDDVVQRDVPAMVRAARDVARGRRVFVVGHSLIGHAAMISAGLGHDGPDAIVGYAPNLWAPHLEPSPLARGAKASLLRAWSASVRLDGYFDSKRFGMGTDGEAADYVAQFAAMWERDHLESTDGATDYEAALARVELDVLAFSSEHDRILARPAAVAGFLALMQNAKVTHRVLPDGPSHIGFVLDPKSRPIWEETARWLVERS